MKSKLRFLNRYAFNSAMAVLGVLLLPPAKIAAAPLGMNGSIPAALKPSLQTRLNAFTKAQADGDWKSVAALMGRTHGGGHHAYVYNPEQKQCLIAQMKLLPLISFKMQKEMFSTEILGMPLSERWWFVSGDAVLRTPDGEKSQNLSMIAYRNQGSWFLVPLQLDDYWEKIHPEPDLLTVDRASEITIHNSKDCPLEIANLHALVNKDYHSIRNLTFVLQNHTDKKVKGYTLRLYARGGDQIYSAPYEIEPGSERAEKMDSTRYSSLCEGIVQDNLIVDDVQFSDGTSWDRHSPRRNSRTPLR